jgi:hypothetical protein
VSAHPSEQLPARRRRRLAPPPRWLLVVAVAATLFAVGVAVGESLRDNPRPGLTTTNVTTLSP